MSYIFDHEDETLWSPTLRVGELYVGFLKCIADLLGRPTGLIANAADMYYLDIEQFEALTRNMIEEYSRSSYQLYRQQLGSVLVVSIVMLERAGYSLAGLIGDDPSLLQAVRLVSLDMPS
jgi:hypothetical protein